MIRIEKHFAMVHLQKLISVQNIGIFMNNFFAGKRGDEHILVGRKRWREENECRL